MLPFKETLVESNLKYDEVIREFSKDTNNEDLNWHRDRENRHVKVISGSEWYIQFENELPRLMPEGFSFIINKNKWHRIINKNSSNLTLRIRKYK